MTKLAIYTFGYPRAVLADNTAMDFPTKKTLELLLLAALSNERTVSRSEVATTMRTDHSESAARRALSTDLWRLRKAFDAAGLPSIEALETDGKSIAIRSDVTVFVDAVYLDNVWREVADRAPGTLEQLDIDRVRRAVDLYVDDFACSLDQEWCFLYRERLRSVRLSLVGMLMDHAVAHDHWADAIHWAETLLTQDPLLEHAHRTLMRCHFLMGNRAIAIRHFSSCRSVLAQELGVEPSEETMRMYRGLVSISSEAPHASASLDAGAANNLRLARRNGANSEKPLTDQLSMALGSIDAARNLVANVDRRLRSKPSS